MLLVLTGGPSPAVKTQTKLKVRFVTLLLVFLAFLGQITSFASEQLWSLRDLIFHPFTTCFVPKPPAILLHKQTQAILAQTLVN